MPILTLTTAGTRQAIKTSTDYSVNGVPMETKRFCRAATFILGTPGATIYLGLPAPLGVSNTVSSTVYDLALNDAAPSVTIGLGSKDNDVDLGNVFWDASANGTTLSLAAETT